MNKNETVIISFRTTKQVEEILNKFLKRNPKFINRSDVMRRAIEEFIKRNDPSLLR